MSVASYPDDIKTEPEINPLLPLHRHIVPRAVPKTHPLDPVAPPLGSHDDPDATRGGQTPRPVVRPHRRPFGVRNTGIEVDADNDPTSHHEDSGGKFRRVVIGMIVPKASLACRKRFWLLKNETARLICGSTGMPAPKNHWDALVYLHGQLPVEADRGELDHLVLSSGDFGLAYLTERWTARFLGELWLSAPLLE